MRNRRSEFSNRRHQIAMPRVPFKDSNGATITESRRKIPDRRLCNMQSELADEQERGKTLALIINTNVEPEIVNNTQCDMSYACLSEKIVCNVEPYLERDVIFLGWLFCMTVSNVIRKIDRVQTIYKMVYLLLKIIIEFNETRSRLFKSLVCS